MSELPLILKEKIGERKNIALVIINRQESMNCFNSQMLDELEQKLNILKKDSKIRAAIITAEGKSFATGADLKWMASLDEQTYNQLIGRGQDVLALIEDLPFPVIAAINGFALGGGMELALACDIRIASEDAVFGQPEVTLGLSPGWGATFRLQNIAGVGVAKELILTGKKISANEAKKRRIVSAVYPQEQLREKAIELAELITKNAPLAVRESKKAIQQCASCTLVEGYEVERNSAKICFASKDLKEGISALLEKRQANFGRE